MKNIVLFILSCFFIQNVYAGSGKAIVPQWFSANHIDTVIWVTNITDHTLNVTVTPYGKDGQVITPTRFEGFITGNTQLAPKSSGFVEITAPLNTFNHGHATIEWSNISGENDTVGLVSHAYGDASNQPGVFRSSYSIPVHNGMPF